MIRHKAPKYIHTYVDRHCKIRIYLRLPGKPQLPLPGPLYSEEFFIAYCKALKTNGSQVNMVVRTKPGTINSLIVEYYNSGTFQSKAKSTQRTYRSQLEAFRTEHGDKPVALLKARHIEAILGEVARTSTAQASKLRKRLSTLMQLAVKWEYRDDNPMLYVDRIAHKERGYRTWTEEDISKFRSFWQNGTPQRLAFEILLFTGLRRSDAVRLGRQHIRNSSIVIHTKKSGFSTRLDIPIHPTLKTHLESQSIDNLTFVVTELGKPRSEKAFTNWFREAAHKAGLPKDSSPHGLRKAACRRLAEAGCTTHQIMAITGHRNLAEVDTYTRNIDRKRLAETAIAAIKDE